MNDLLEQVIANTVANRTNTVSVVSVNNDVTTINFVAGMSDPGEMIACGYRPELRRMEGEQDGAYAARILPLVMALPAHERDIIMNAAIRRADLDTSNGKVSAAFAGKPGWHGLGTTLSGVFDSRTGINAAGLGWTMAKIPLSYVWEGQCRTSDEAFAIVRTDTGAQLGTVGSKYAIIQNSEAFAFLDGVLSEFGANYESAGSIHGGKRVWMLAHMPKQRFEVRGDGTCEPYVLFSNPNDGTGAAVAFPTAVRVECSNTNRMAINGRKGGINIRHTGSVAGKMRAAQEALGLSVKSFETFKDSADVMARTPINPETYANDLLDQVLDMTAADAALGADKLLEATILATQSERDAKRKSIERQIRRRESILHDMIERYESERCTPKGTAWASYNAATESADHGALNGRFTGDGRERAEKRFESIIDGRADEIKQVAYEMAMTATRA